MAPQTWTESRAAAPAPVTESDDDGTPADGAPKVASRSKTPAEAVGTPVQEDETEGEAGGQLHRVAKMGSTESGDGPRRGQRRISVTSSVTSAGERLNVEDIFAQDAPSPGVDSPYAFMYRNSGRRPLSVHAKRMMRKTMSDKQPKAMRASPGPWFTMRFFGDSSRDGTEGNGAAAADGPPHRLQSTQSLPMRLSRKARRPAMKGRKIDSEEEEEAEAVSFESSTAGGLTTASQTGAPPSSDSLSSSGASQPRRDAGDADAATRPSVSFAVDGSVGEAKLPGGRAGRSATSADGKKSKGNNKGNNKSKGKGSNKGKNKGSSGTATQRVDSPAFEEELKCEALDADQETGSTAASVEKHGERGRNKASPALDNATAQAVVAQEQHVREHSEERYESNLKGKVTSAETMPKTDRFGFFAWDHAPQERVSAQEQEQRVQKETEREAKWEHMLERWPRYRSSRKLKKRLRKGLPNKLRGRLWVEFSGYRLRSRRSPGLYRALCRTDVKIAFSVGQQIDRDIYRTFPQHYMFRVNWAEEDDGDQKNPCLCRVSSEDSDESSGGTVATSGAGGVLTGTVECGPGIFPLRRVLQAYARYDTELGYCQGMNYLAAMCLMYMPEEEAFHTLCYLLNRKHGGFRGLFVSQMPLARVMFHSLSSLLRKVDAQLWRHFQSINLQIGDFFVPWLFTLFAGQFPFALVARVWDVILHCGRETEEDLGLDRRTGADSAGEPSDQSTARTSIFEILRLSTAGRGRASGNDARRASADPHPRRTSSVSMASSATHGTHATKREDDSVVSPEDKDNALGDVSGYKAILRISLALLCEHRRTLLSMDFADAMVFLVSEVPRNTDSERIVKRAFAMQLTSKEVRSCMRRAANELCGGRLNFCMGLEAELERIRFVEQASPGPVGIPRDMRRYDSSEASAEP